MGAVAAEVIKSGQEGISGTGGMRWRMRRKRGMCVCVCVEEDRNCSGCVIVVDVFAEAQ